MKPIFLIGYMACGKTTLGRALARATGRPHYDLDFYISQRFRCPVERLFKERGEEAFRQIEAAMLREVGEFDNAIISCGGGTPCFGTNMGYMLSRGLTVWLRTTPEHTVARLAQTHTRRPLLEGLHGDELLHHVAAHMQQRLGHYSRALATFDSTQLDDRGQIQQSVARFMAEIYPLQDQ